MIAQRSCFCFHFLYFCWAHTETLVRCNTRHNSVLITLLVLYRQIAVPRSKSCSAKHKRHRSSTTRKLLQNVKQKKNMKKID